MKILAIGTLIFVIMLLMLFALVLIVTQNREDLGYCPSNVMGFDPENPHRMLFKTFSNSEYWINCLIKLKILAKIVSSIQNV